MTLAAVRWPTCSRALLVGALIGLPLAALILWIMGAPGALWWLWAWGAWVAFNLLLLVLYPTVIAPLFNKFEPLADEALKAARAGADAALRLRRQGPVRDGRQPPLGPRQRLLHRLGAAKRVVFFDTLLQRLSPGEVEAVLAHELGHFKHRHVLKRMVGDLRASAWLALALLGWLSTQTRLLRRPGRARPTWRRPTTRWRCCCSCWRCRRSASSSSPLMAQLSRRHEFEADAYACAQASGRDLASALLKLHEDNAATLTPDPLYVRFYYSHPPASERLAALAPAAR